MRVSWGDSTLSYFGLTGRFPPLLPVQIKRQPSAESSFLCVEGSKDGTDPMEMRSAHVISEKLRLWVKNTDDLWGSDEHYQSWHTPKHRRSPAASVCHKKKQMWFAVVHSSTFVHAKTVDVHECSRSCSEVFKTYLWLPSVAETSSSHIPHPLLLWVSVYEQDSCLPPKIMTLL